MCRDFPGPKCSSSVRSLQPERLQGAAARTTKGPRVDSSTAMKDCPVCGILAAPPSAPPGAVASGGGLCWRAEAVRLYRAGTQARGRGVQVPASAPPRGRGGRSPPLWHPYRLLRSRRGSGWGRGGRTSAVLVLDSRLSRSRSALPALQKKLKSFFFSRRPFAGCCSSSFGQWGWRRARRMGFTPWRARCCDPGRRKSRGAARGLVPRSPSARRRAAWWLRQLRAG